MMEKGKKEEGKQEEEGWEQSHCFQKTYFVQF